MLEKSIVVTIKNSQTYSVNYLCPITYKLKNLTNVYFS
jgi:hypothetical protein